MPHPAKRTRQVRYRFAWTRANSFLSRDLASQNDREESDVKPGMLWPYCVSVPTVELDSAKKRKCWLLKIGLSLHRNRRDTLSLIQQPRKKKSTRCWKQRPKKT